MATTKNTNSLDTAKAIAAAKGAIKQITAASAVPGAVNKENVREFANLVDDLIADLQALKAPHKKMLAVVASEKSRLARKERVAKALALLEASEAETATA